MYWREVHTDVLIIGAGLAGSRSAIAAREVGDGHSVTVAAPSLPGYGGCGWETHGVNAATTDDDSPTAHAADTLAAGGQLNSPRLVEILCNNIVGELSYLTSIGVRFDERGVGHEKDLGLYGGSSHSRSLHVSDITGLVISQALLREVVTRDITVLASHWLIALLATDDHIAGAVMLDKKNEGIVVIRSGSVVLATGGGAGMYAARSVSDDKTGSGIACALRLGLTARDMEMVQFHPTGFDNGDGIGHGSLLEEELRAQGARLVNSSGEAFMKKYDVRGEIATRDIVARAIAAERRATRGGIALDATEFSREYLAMRFPNTVRRLRAFGFDMLEQRKIPVIPTAHFLMGGIEIDETCATDLGGLFCAGEDSGGVHGGNRVGGNGVAEALVFGQLAGNTAAQYSTNGVPEGTRLDRGLRPIGLALASADKAASVTREVRRVMSYGAGPIRSRDQLGACARSLDGLLGWAEIYETTTATLDATTRAWSVADALCTNQAENLLLVARAIVSAARWRQNNVGAHYIENPTVDWEHAKCSSRATIDGATPNAVTVGCRRQ